MVKCHVCNRSAELECPNCGHLVCERHDGSDHHGCLSSRQTDAVSGDSIEITAENSVTGSINISTGGDDNKTNNAGSADAEKLERLVEIKKKMNGGTPSESSTSALLTKALHQTSELKTAAVDQSTDRSELMSRVERINRLLEDIDNINGEALADVENSQSVLQGMQASFEDEDRAKLRNAAASLEDELHTLL